MEILFPTDISYSSAGGPRFKTTVFESDSGYEQRNIDWSAVKSNYNVSQAIKSQTQMDALTNFFMVVNGRANWFRFKDWNDFTIEDMEIGVGDGTTVDFQITQTYSWTEPENSVTVSYVRTIVKIAWGSLTEILIDGTPNSDFTIDETTGIITFDTAPALAAVITVVYCEFHVPCRFDTDALEVIQEFWETSSWPHIPIVETRDWGQLFS